MKPNRKWYSIFLNNRGEVDIVDDKKTDDDDTDIVIDGDEDDLEDKNDDDIILDDDDDDKDTDDDIRARNKAFASMRVENKDLKNRIERLENAPAPPPQPKYPDPVVNDGVPKTESEWDDLAEKDWKKAVDLRSTINANNIIQTQKQETKYERTLNESKQRVIAVHPELNDNASEKTKIFTQILNENPEYVNNPKGPIYAMRDMEDYMETTLGYKRKDIISAEKKGASRESERQNRIVLNKGGKANKDTKGKIVISKDEMDFCKFNDIDPKTYAKNRKKLSAKKGDE